MASAEQDPAPTPGPGAEPAARPGAAPRERLRLALRLVACAVAAESLSTVVLSVLPSPSGAAARLAANAILLAALLAPAALLLVKRSGEKGLEVPRDPAITALEAAANGIVLVDPQGTILWANRAFLALTGYEAGELVGRHTRILESGCHDDAFYANLWKTVSSGRVWHGVVVNRRKDGSLYTEEMTITPVMAPGGTITHYVAIKQDISRRLATDRALLDAQRRFNSFMDDSPAVAFVKDSTGRYLYINKMFESVFNVTSDQLLGRTDFDIWPEPVAAQFREHDAQILTHGQARQFSELTETADGSLRRWLVLKFPISHSAAAAWWRGWRWT